MFATSVASERRFLPSENSASTTYSVLCCMRSLVNEVLVARMRLPTQEIADAVHRLEAECLDKDLAAPSSSQPVFDEGVRCLIDIGTLSLDDQKEFMYMLRALRATFLKKRLSSESFS